MMIKAERTKVFLRHRTEKLAAITDSSLSQPATLLGWRENFLVELCSSYIFLVIDFDLYFALKVSSAHSHLPIKQNDAISIDSRGERW
jgi:hypothetical protein